jgi:choline dehydrogenase
VGYLRCIGNPRTDWRFRTEPEAALNGRDLLYPRGKVLGGSSSINGMIYMRGQARDYDAWAAATGDDAWRWSNVLPDFRAHQCSFRCSDDEHPHHGARGEWLVSKQRLRWDILDAFAEAAAQAGIAHVDDFNTGDNAGVSYFDVNQRGGFRVSSAKAFLKPARSRGNLAVWTRALTEKLTFTRDANGALRCTGATLSRGGERMTVRVVKPGEEAGQGVGYLEDGTMVVVEQGRPHLNEEVEFTVTSALQTSAGRMIFGRLGVGQDPQPRRRQRTDTPSAAS